MDLRPAKNAAVTAAAIIPLLLALTMAVVSKPDAHPDEINHIEAGRYYMKYWDPPKAGDPRTIESLSKYGISYLNQFESVYFFAGKFASVACLFGLPDYLGLRFFNLSLFALVVAMALSLRGASRLAFLPVFLSPQVWYVFSYFNGDALPLALAMIPVYLVAKDRFPWPDGHVPGIGEPSLPLRIWAPVLAASALIFTCKMNYYVLIASLFAFASLIAANAGNWRVAAKVALAAAILALVCLAGRLEFDNYVSGETAGKAQAVAEQYAQPDFKPSSQDIGVAHFGIHMREMGLSYKDLFVVWDWHIWTFRTSFGTYDYMKIYAPFIYYRYMSWALTGLFLAVLIPLVRAGREERLLAALFVVFASACVFQSTWHSWVNDFQAQGRYLFPVAAMAGLTIGRCRERLHTIFVPVFAGAMYALSLYSFIFVGLANIPR